MNGITITTGQIVVGGLAAVALTWFIVSMRASNRRARAAAQVAQVGTRAVSLVGRTVLTAAVIVGGQWAVITWAPRNTTLVLVVLAVPALLSAYTLTKALTVTEVRSTRRELR